MEATRSAIILLAACLLLLLVGSRNFARASGIFELNLASLVDSYGRDLRLDCCAWQNATAAQEQQQQQQQQRSHQQLANNLIHYNYQQQVSNGVRQSLPAGQQFVAAADSCDPTKCQLIVRICVKNYQTQIDPNQCTFGELTAQVAKPAGAGSPLDLSHSMSSLARLQQQQQLASMQRLRLNPTANIHHQRMLMQQIQQQQQLGAGSLALTHEQHARLYHNQAPGNFGRAAALRQVAFDQPISFPFNFTWPGAFSLVIDTWYESPTGLQPASRQQQHQQQPQQQQQQHPQHFAHNHHHLHAAHHLQGAQQHATTTYDLYKKQLILQHSMHGWLAVKNEWTNGAHKTDTAMLAYSYRVTCQPNYYGEQCNILCRPRDDVYGHFTCNDQGDVVCLAGWQGKYCEEPICSPGCVRDQGNCTRPNECQCRFGWQGQACEQCVRYPGCVHGTCLRPHECNCEEGWGGLLCNEDLNYCSNHQPCKNGGLCTNTFDQTGVGSYACACEDGYAGKNCERKLAAGSNNPAQSSSSAPVSHSSNNNSTLSGAANQQPQGHASSAQVPPSASTKSQATRAPAKPTNSLAGSTTARGQAAQDQLVAHQFYATTSAQSTAAAGHLDHRVMVAYCVIIVCMVILIVLLLLRLFFNRLSGALAGCGQRLVAGGSWPSVQEAVHRGGGGSRSRHSARDRRHRRAGHHGHSLQSAIYQTEDVATLQNNQNIYKSRTSLSYAGAEKGAAHYGQLAGDTMDGDCATSSSSADSMLSTSCEDLSPASSRRQISRAQALQAAAMQAQYASASAHYYAPPPPLFHPAHHAHAHLANAHSVHNLTSATYQRLNQHLSAQPPPPPYTISSNSMSHSGSVYSRSQAAAYGNCASGAPSGGHYHPASCLAVPTSRSSGAANASSVYSSGHSTYGTAATLAAHHALSSLATGGAYGFSGYGSAPATTKNHKQQQQQKSAAKSATQSQDQEHEINESAAGQSQSTASAEANDSNTDTENVADVVDSQTATTSTTAATSPYGNLGAVTEQQSGADSSQQQQQSPCYLILCNHI